MARPRPALRRRSGFGTLLFNRLFLPAIAGAALLAGSATDVAYQDVAEMFGGKVPAAERWLARLVPTPSGSVHVASLAPSAAERLAATAEIVVTPRLDTIVKGAVAPTFEPPEVNRAPKGDLAMTRLRPVVVSAFTAGVLAREASVFDAAPGEAVALLLPKDATKAIAAVVRGKRGSAAAATPGAAVAETDAIAYAPSDPAADGAPFDALLGKPGTGAPMAIGKDGKRDHFWVTFPIPQAAKSKSEQRCLAEAIYFEARSEPIKGQLAVAQVVINRLKNPAYPATICGVVYQNRTMRNACQFSFACDGIKDRVTDRRAWSTAQTLARRVLFENNWWSADVGSATHYHATYVRPRWARTMKKMQKIGRHVFYKTYGGGWS
ncbi:cell wall hydrolase [Prosthecomicrobium pneumaticum]|uniref:Spore germination cell wall hydrolase CwlJ-like protein n=1 Tax=Prosthecomicrobium pneumaticum TaxID=81895 RepID=A0A7W9CV67_9HYPH|nr:cell wall hydrolase [Prosthecomicrobium pneumaticum]MBB5751952.1 spore germination cell wall hydrolase CwlJ-like protein [Prosthecomicrobium pneumaticum]